MPGEEEDRRWLSPPPPLRGAAAGAGGEEVGSLLGVSGGDFGLFPLAPLVEAAVEARSEDSEAAAAVAADISSSETFKGKGNTCEFRILSGFFFSIPMFRKSSCQS